jgi:SnoaL-like domain/Anhydro-N-acetylmuramic acid kinase
MLLGEVFSDDVLEFAKDAEIKIEDINVVSAHCQTIWLLSMPKEGEIKSALAMSEPAVIAAKSGRTVVPDFVFTSKPMVGKARLLSASLTLSRSTTPPNSVYLKRSAASPMSLFFPAPMQIAVSTRSTILTPAQGMSSLMPQCDTSPTISSEVAALKAELEQVKAIAYNAVDVEAVRKLQNIYGYYLDKCLYEQVVNLFDEKGSVVFHSGIYKGRAGAKRLFVDRFHAVFTNGRNGPVHRYSPSHQIKIDFY